MILCSKIECFPLKQTVWKTTSDKSVFTMVINFCYLTLTHIKLMHYLLQKKDAAVKQEGIIDDADRDGVDIFFTRFFFKFWVIKS